MNADGKIRKPWSGWGGLVRPRYEMSPPRNGPISCNKKISRNRGGFICEKNGSKGDSNVETVTTRKSGQYAGSFSEKKAFLFGI